MPQPTNPEAATGAQASAESKLSEIALKQIAFKPTIMRDAMVQIIVSMLKDRIQWSDEMDFTFIGPESRNCIGMAWRTLLKVGLIKQMQQSRKSIIKKRNGARAWKYRIASIPMAETFLKRNGSAVPSRGQPELFGVANR